MKERSKGPSAKKPTKKSVTSKVNNKKVNPKSTVDKTVKKTSGKVKRTPLKRKKLDPQDLDFKYKGKEEKWLIVELNEDCELKESAEVVVQQIKDLCGSGVEYFLPMYTEYVKDSPVFLVLFEGYIFIRVTDKVHEGCFKDRTEHISGPLICGGQNKYLKNKDINGFKTELKKRLRAKVPKKGQIVIPKVGDYKNLEGLVLSVDRKNMTAKIEFALSSRVVEVNIRIINLEVME